MGSRDLPQGSRACLGPGQAGDLGPGWAPNAGAWPGFESCHRCGSGWTLGKPPCLSLPLRMAELQPCLREGLGELGMGDVLSSSPFLGDPIARLGCGGAGPHSHPTHRCH